MKNPIKNDPAVLGNLNLVSEIHRLKQSAEILYKTIQIAEQIGYPVARILGEKNYLAHQNIIKDLETEIQRSL